VAAPQLTELKPARPAGIKLVDEKFQRCGKMVCLPPAAAQRLVQNKVEIYGWMSSANAVMDYYEGRPAPGTEAVTAPLPITVAKSRLSNLFSRSKK
jgi:hypothetical protein